MKKTILDSHIQIIPITNSKIALLIYSYLELAGCYYFNIQLKYLR